MNPPKSAIRVYDTMMRAPDQWWLVPVIMEAGGFRPWTAYPGLAWLEANGRVEGRFIEGIRPRRRQYRLVNGGNPPPLEAK